MSKLKVCALLPAMVIVCSNLAVQAAFAAPPDGEKSGRGGRSNQSQASNMSCEQMSAASRGTMTVEACQKMMAAQQAYTTALADPSASRPGDDKLTCEQIATEVKQQPFSPPDQAKAAEAQAASSDLQKTLEKQQKEAAERAAAQSATNLAAAAAAGLAPNFVQAKAAEKAAEDNRKFGEEKAKESAPKAQRANDATADLIADAGQQIGSNPRLARLMQLASQKRCKIQ
jgi:hypothetical protein